MRLARLLEQRQIIDAEIDELNKQKKRGGRGRAAASKVKREREAGHKGAAKSARIDLVTSDEEQEEPMDDEAGDQDVAAAAPLTPIKRERQDGNDSAAASEPSSKAARSAHSADASSSAAAAAAAAPAPSRSRIPQPAGNRSAIPPRPQPAPAAAASSVAPPASARSHRRGQGDDHEADTQTEEEKEAQAPAAVRTSKRQVRQTPAAAAAAESGAFAAAIRASRPVVKVPAGFKTVRALNVTTTMGADPYLHYGGKDLPVFLHGGTGTKGCHYLCFDALFPLMVESGLLPAEPPRPLRVDHPSWSPALRMLLYFHENHAEFSQMQRIIDHDDRYDDPVRWTLLLYGVESVLLEQPFFTQEECDDLDDEKTSCCSQSSPCANPSRAELHSVTASAGGATVRRVSPSSWSSLASSAAAPLTPSSPAARGTRLQLHRLNRADRKPVSPS